MRLKTVLISMIVLVTAACSGSPEIVHDSLPDLLMPKPGMAKLVVYSPHSYVWSNITANIGLGGTTGCKLKNSTFALYDVTPGQLYVSASLCNGNGVSVLKIQIEPGQKYYVQVIPNDPSLAGVIAGSGVPTTKNPKLEEPSDREVISGKVTQKPEIMQTHAEGTAFQIDLIDEQQAIRQLHTLKMLSE